MRTLSVFVLILTLAPALQAADWPQFRGPNCSGVAKIKASLPAKFSAKQNVKWSAEVGDGIGSPIVAAGRLFVNGMTSKDTISLIAFDASSGEQLWRRDWKTGPLAEIHKTNSQAATTPAADDERVYFYFSTLGLLAVDAATGRDVWHKKLPTPFFVFKWGAGMSPILHKDKVIFCQDDDLNPAMYAFDKVSGELRWKDDRLDMAVNYSHPVICRTNGRDEIVVAGTGMLVGYDPDSGKRKWRASVLLRNIKTTPIVRDGVIYISLQSAGIANQWLASVDRAETGNNDNKLDRDEIQAFVGDLKVPPAFFERTFGRGDLNKDGYLEGKELDLAFLHPDNFAGADFTASGDAAAAAVTATAVATISSLIYESYSLWRYRCGGIALPL